MTREKYLLALLMASGGCVEAETSEGAVAVRITPLTLPGVTDVCWSLSLSGGDGVSWSADALCASRYGGAELDVRYVVPCDPAGETLTLTATMVSLSIEGVALPPGAWSNPCDEGCSVPVTCEAGAITPATIDVTVGRPLVDGVTDALTRFDQVACDASVSCADDAGAPLIAPLGPNGAAPAVAVSVTCALPEAGGVPWLYWSWISIACDAGGGSVALDLPVAEGSDAPIVGWTAHHTLSSVVDSGFTAEADVVIATNPGFFSGACALTGLVTVHDGAFDGHELAPGVSWPAIVFDVPLDAAARALCGREVLGGGRISFQDVTGPLPFTYAFDGVDLFRVSRGGEVIVP